MFPFRHTWIPAVPMLLAGACLLGACSHDRAPASAIVLPPTGDAAAARTISFIHYNDLHAHLVPHLDLIRTENASVPTELGGLARIATMVKRIRSENPNSVLMNIGDTYHGGVEALYTDGNAVVAPMNALGVDIGVPGNWDWAYGPDVTRLRYKGEALDGCPQVAAMALMYGLPDIQRPSFPNLGGNVSYAFPSIKTGKPFLPPTATMDIGGVKVGFIGITSDIVPRMHATLAACLSFLSTEAEYADYVRTHARSLRDTGAQVVVVMSELGIHKDKRLADLIDSGLVDVFFSAHTHEATFEPLNSASGAIVVEAGNDGYVGRMDVSVSDAGAVTARSWQLVPVTADIAEDPEMKALVDQARAPFLQPVPGLALRKQFGGHVLRESIATVIGQAPYLMSRRQALENSFNDAFTDALRTTAGTDIALTPGFRFDAVNPAAGMPIEDNTVATGAITLEDAYLFFPAPVTLATGSITGASLRKIIEENLTAVFSPDRFAQNGGWFDGYSGLEIRIDLAAPDGQRVQELRRAGDSSLIGEADTLTAAGCRRPADTDSATMCSYASFADVSDLSDPATGDAWYVVDFFRHALAQGLLPGAPRQSIEDVSGTPMWPADPFYQPLEGVGSP